MRKRYVRPLSAKEQEELTQRYRGGGDAAEAQRCHAVLLSAAGRVIPTIAELLQTHQATVHRWLDRFEVGGVEALATVAPPGRPPCWDETYEVALVETVRHDPRWYGLEHSVWTCRLLAGYLAEHLGVALSAERVRVLLHRHGIRLKQPTAVVHSRDPRYHPKGRGLRRSA
jgi:transposase